MNSYTLKKKIWNFFSTSLIENWTKHLFSHYLNYFFQDIWVHNLQLSLITSICDMICVSLYLTDANMIILAEMVHQSSCIILLVWILQYLFILVMLLSHKPWRLTVNLVLFWKYTTSISRCSSKLFSMKFLSAPSLL